MTEWDQAYMRKAVPKPPTVTPPWWESMLLGLLDAALVLVLVGLLAWVAYDQIIRP